MSMRSHLSALLLGLSLSAGVFAQPDQGAGQELIELSAGLHRIEAEVADDAAKRQKGLMHREALAENRGMLFVYERRRAQCMWMKNTLIPLSVAFIDAEGRIINIARMQPRSLQSHCSDGPADYALEMNQGWFAERGIESGDRLRGLPARD